jgi:hypothetical protein
MRPSNGEHFVLNGGRRNAQRSIGGRKFSSRGGQCADCDPGAPAARAPVLQAFTVPVRSHPVEPPIRGDLLTYPAKSL